jgi:hypothetical protein
VEKAMEFWRSYLAVRAENENVDASDLDEDDDDVKSRYVFLHGMEKQTDNRDNLRHQILHVFLAGHDSSAITIRNAIFHLYRNPETWKKLRSEVLSEADKPFTFESLKGLHFLQYVIKESKYSDLSTYLNHHHICIRYVYIPSLSQTHELPYKTPFSPLEAALKAPHLSSCKRAQ